MGFRQQVTHRCEALGAGLAGGQRYQGYSSSSVAVSWAGVGGRKGLVAMATAVLIKSGHLSSLETEEAELRAGGTGVSGAPRLFSCGHRASSMSHCPTEGWTLMRPLFGQEQQFFLRFYLFFIWYHRL